MDWSTLFELFWVLSDFIVKVWSPVLIMTGWLVIIALLVKLKRW